MQKFQVTYEIVTHESAESGEAAESGFIMPGLWRFAADDPGPVEMDLRSALKLCRPTCDCGRWFADESPDIDYRTGAEETRAIHPPQNITPASYGRLKRLFNCR